MYIFTVKEYFVKSLEWKHCSLSMKKLISRKFCQEFVKRKHISGKKIWANSFNVSVCTFISRVFQNVEISVKLQCFKSRDDNFSSNYFITKGQFQTLIRPMVNPIFCHSYWGQICTQPLLPLIRVMKSRVNQEHRKVRQKIWLGWRKIVVSRVETL